MVSDFVPFGTPCYIGRLRARTGGSARPTRDSCLAETEPGVIKWSKTQDSKWPPNWGEFSWRWETRGSMEREVKRESFRGAFDNRQVSSLDQEIEGGKGFVTHLITNLGK